MPLMGARSEGAVGFGKGLATGAVAAVAFPTAGLVTGAVQVFRGVANTPEAVAANNEEKVVYLIVVVGTHCHDLTRYVSSSHSSFFDRCGTL